MELPARLKTHIIFSALLCRIHADVLMSTIVFVGNLRMHIGCVLIDAHCAGCLG